MKNSTKFTLLGLLGIVVAYMTSDKVKQEVDGQAKKAKDEAKELLEKSKGFWGKFQAIFK